MNKRRDDGCLIFTTLRWSLLAVIAVMLVLPLFQNAQAQRRGKGSQKRRIYLTGTSGGYKIGEPINITGMCEGKINFPEKQLNDADASIAFENNRFTITPVGGLPLKGRLSVIARSSHLLSMSVNLTFDPQDALPLLTISLRGCYNLSTETCEKPALGQVGTINPGLTLERIQGGEPRDFSFTSTPGSSCQLKTEP